MLKRSLFNYFCFDLTDYALVFLSIPFRTLLNTSILCLGLTSAPGSASASILYGSLLLKTCGSAGRFLVEFVFTIYGNNVAPLLLSFKMFSFFLLLTLFFMREAGLLLGCIVESVDVCMGVFFFLASACC